MTPRRILVIGLILCALASVPLVAGEDRSSATYVSTADGHGHGDLGDLHGPAAPGEHGVNTGHPLDAGDDEWIIEDDEEAMAADRTIDFTQEFARIPDQPGTIAIEHQYGLPENLASMEVSLPAQATVTDTDGFRSTGENTWEWDGQTDDPTLTYELPANRTTNREDPIAGPGDFLFADTREWSLVMRPGVGHSWSWRGGDRVGIDRTPTVLGEGAASEVMVFMGPYEEHRRTAHGQTFTFIEPAAADMVESPADVLDSMVDASNTLRVGDRDPNVFIVAAPTDTVEWGALGLQSGQADMWIRDRERLDDPNNVWLHEYVHSRQDYQAESDFRWFTEGIAVYYAALLSLEQGLIEYEDFETRLASGERARFDTVRLTQPGTWEGNNGNYHVGALVSGALDREIRTATESGGSFQDAWARLNAQDGPVSASDFERAVARAADSTVRETAREWTRTPTRPTTWSVETHRDVFGTVPATFAYTIDTDGFSIEGPYRSGGIDSEDGGPVIVPNETLTIPVDVENVGSESGEYDAPVVIDGTEVETRTGTLDPGARTSLTVSHTFETAGTHRIQVGDVAQDVFVREPAEPTVREVRVQPEEITAGEEATITATVENTANRPAHLDLPVQVDNETVAVETVRLDVGASDTIEVDHVFEDAGTYTIGFGDIWPDAMTVTVEAAPLYPDPIPDPTPGFGVAAALLALVAGGAVGVAARRN